MSTSSLSPGKVLEVVDGLGPPGTPVTTPEVAAKFDCTDRTIYNKLEALVEDGPLETKKVGARGRVWWQPAGENERTEHDSEATVTESTFRQLFENVPGLYLIVEPENYEIVAVSDAYLEATMTDRAEIMGKTLFEVFPADPEDPDPEGAPRLRRSLERVKAERETDVMPVTFYPIPRPGSENDEFEDRWWSPTNAPVVDESGDINYIIHRVEDVTPVVQQLQDDRNTDVLDRLDTRDSHLATDIMLRGQELHQAKEKAYERLRESESALERLNTATRELLDAEPETIADRVAPLVRDVLDVEYASLWQYDDQHGDLEEYAADVSPDLDSDAVEFPTEIADQVWEVFVGTDIDVTNDLDVSTDATKPLRSRAFVPLGRHGVVCLGSTGADTFDERTVDLVETVAATVATAWERADSEEALTRQNKELTRLERLNSLIRAIDQALVGADTRETVDEAVCKQLATSDLYESAWLATYDAETNSLRPQAWAGIDSGYLEDRTVTVGDASSDDPLVVAHQTREMQVVSDIATDARAVGWREVALKRGARSCLTIPLVYGESRYGILTVYGRTPQPDDRETDVLAELGGTIAHAIHALEATTTRRTDSVVELTLQTTTAETPLVRFARELDCMIEFKGLVPGGDGGTTVFFTARDVSPDEMLAAAEQLLAIEELNHVADREIGSLFNARLADATLPARFLEQGTTIRLLSIDAGTATAVVELPESAEVRELTDNLRRDVPGLKLLSRRTQTREPEPTLQSTVLDRLTPRQQEVLQLAYRSGYFEIPRTRSGKELADVLGIVSSTFTKHIRNAERNVFDVIFADEQESREVMAK